MQERNSERVRELKKVGDSFKQDITGYTKKDIHDVRQSFYRVTDRIRAENETNSLSQFRVGTRRIGSDMEVIRTK